MFSLEGLTPLTCDYNLLEWMFHAITVSTSVNAVSPSSIVFRVGGTIGSREDSVSHFAVASNGV